MPATLIATAGLGLTAPAQGAACTTAVYVANLGSDSVTPINAATSRGRPAPVGSQLWAVVVVCHRT